MHLDDSWCACPCHWQQLSEMGLSCASPRSEWGSGVGAMRADLEQYGPIERAFIVHNAEGQSKVSIVASYAGAVSLATCIRP